MIQTFLFGDYIYEMFSQDNSYVYEVMALSTSDHFPSSMYLYDKSYVLLERVALLTIDLLHLLHL